MPVAIYSCYYLLMCAVPFLIVAAPMEFGPEVFSTIICWRLFSNGIIIYYALLNIDETHYLDTLTGLYAYFASLGLAVIGLTLFFKFMNPNFNRSLFWKVRDSCVI